MNASAWMEKVSSLGCCVCKRLGIGYVPAQVHHVAEGSGVRSDFAVSCLCREHHQGQSGLHGMGTKAFIRLYRLPGESEYGLLVWQTEDLAKQDAVVS